MYSIWPNGHEITLAPWGEGRGEGKPGMPMNSIDFIYRFDPTNPQAKPPPADPETARQVLEEGNSLFARWVDSCRGDHPSPGETAFISHYHLQDLGLPTPAGDVAPQAPFAVLLGCS